MSRFFKVVFILWYLLLANTTFAYDRYDTLRGSNGSGRNWWDLTHYELHVELDTVDKAIRGTVVITFKVTALPQDSMQIDLQSPMQVEATSDGIAGYGTSVFSFVRDSNVYWLTSKQFTSWKLNSEHSIAIQFSGKPHIATNPPWDGGLTWTHDNTGKFWASVSCQGLGASVWWPCKDVQWDEPDKGVDLFFTFKQKEIKYPIVSNGRLISVSDSGYHWRVVNPINNYDITFYTGDYAHWSDTLIGENGQLPLDYYVLSYNEKRAKKHFEVVKPMLHCFEYWLGPYPFYEDGYKLVEAPYLGMEHQSAVAYGNDYKLGYKGIDRSGTGVGLQFDHLIVHESGHEWFGNNITARDIADNWIQEGFTTYTEALFAECLLGKQDGERYCIGEWKNIANNRPVTGDYGVNAEGSGDMYDKGAAIVFMLRKILHDDNAFRGIMRGLTRKFYHRTINSKDVEQYFSEQFNTDLSPFFNQYLHKAELPLLKYYIKDKQLYYRFTNVDNKFSLPLTVSDTRSSLQLNVNSEWQQIVWKKGYNINFEGDMLFEIAQ